jgi:hypothetical protein
MQRDPNTIVLPPSQPERGPAGDVVIDDLDDAGHRPIDGIDTRVPSGEPDPSETTTEPMPVDQRARPVDRDPSA